MSLLRHRFERVIVPFFVPQGITKAQKHAFDGCIHLERFHWPSSMKTTMPYAFNDCGIATEKSAHEARHDRTHFGPHGLRRLDSSNLGTAERWENIPDGWGIQK